MHICSRYKCLYLLFMFGTWINMLRRQGGNFWDCTWDKPVSCPRVRACRRVDVSLPARPLGPCETLPTIAAFVRKLGKPATSVCTMSVRSKWTAPTAFCGCSHSSEVTVNFCLPAARLPSCWQLYMADALRLHPNSLILLPATDCIGRILLTSCTYVPNSIFEPIKSREINLDLYVLPYPA